jgi:hypothetical protein
MSLSLFQVLIMTVPALLPEQPKGLDKDAAGLHRLTIYNIISLKQGWNFSSINIIFAT